MTTEFTYPSKVKDSGRTDHNGVFGHILEHDHFLFQERPGDFSYQHNSRGLSQFTEGVYDLREVTPEAKIYGFLMFQAAIIGVELVAWIEHTSNWDGFVEVTLKNGRTLMSTWDICLSQGEPEDDKDPILTDVTDDHQKELYLFSEDITARWTHLYLPYLCGDSLLPEDTDPQPDEVAHIPLDEVVELHVWFDT